MNIKSKNIYIYLAAIIFVAVLIVLVMTNKKNSGAEMQINGSARDIGEASLSWNLNKEPDIAGYRIYYGTAVRKEACPPGGYGDQIDAGNVTAYKVENLKKDTTYYFSITSYNKAGKESCFSDEVSKIVK